MATDGDPNRVETCFAKNLVNDFNVTLAVDDQTPFFAHKKLQLLISF